MWIKSKVLFSQKKKAIIVTLLLTEVMNGVYAEYTLKALIKPDIVDLFLKIQKRTISTISKLTSGIRNLNTNFKTLELYVEFC